MQTYGPIQTWKWIGSATAVLLFIALRAGLPHLLPKPEPSIVAELDDLDQAGLVEIIGVSLDRSSGVIRRSRSLSHLDFDVRKAGAELPAVTHLSIHFTPLSPFQYEELTLVYISAAYPEVEVHPTDDIVVQAATPVIQQEADVIVATWNLPEPAVRLKLYLPASAALRISRVVLRHESSPPWRHAAHALVIGTMLAFGLIVLQLIWKPLLIDVRSVKTLLLLGMFGCSSALVFLLPPFQGPDEIGHWQAALSLYRSDAEAEVALYRLNDVLETDQLRFQAHRQFDAKMLRSFVGDGPQDSFTQEVGYAGHHSYPIVAVVSLFFSRVETLSGALWFYYTCRFVPIVLLFALLAWLNQRSLLPFTAIWFFSLPLVMQQFAVISSDTLINLGTLAAVGLFLALERRHNAWLLALLFILCAWVTAAKMGVAVGLMLLPILRLPWSRIPHKRIAIPLAIVGLLAVCLLIGWAGLEAMRNSADPDDNALVDQQFERLSSWEGVAWFLGEFIESFPARLWHPLGWLDTYLTAEHLWLIYTAGALAVLLDVFAIAKFLPAVLRHKKSATAWVLVAAATHAGILSLGTCFVMYLGATPPGADMIYGFQARYLFSAVIVLLLVPQTVAMDWKRTVAITQPSLRSVILPSAALTLLGTVMFAGQVQLVVALLVRYW